VHTDNGLRHGVHDAALSLGKQTVVYQKGRINPSSANGSKWQVIAFEAWMRVGCLVNSRRGRESES
jgi:hypothetical protein